MAAERRIQYSIGHPGPRPIPLASPVPRDTCYFDGQCGMCRRTVRILHALDWFGRLEIKDMTAVPASAAGRTSILISDFKVRCTGHFPAISINFARCSGVRSPLSFISISI